MIMDQFVEQLRQVSPLSDEIVGQLLEEMKEVSFAKGELSIREGERDPFVWFVKTGLVRAFVAVSYTHLDVYKRQLA